jgi:trans-2,3-dihydro-3-hydroxyanthranilate isomerase
LKKSYPYTIVDVFTRDALAGNPLAVLPSASGLNELTMQRIAREFNLSETAFVFPPTREDCAARVRIFSPTKEMAFAGHPTIGTAFVLLQEQIVSRNCSVFLLDEPIGPVLVRIEGGRPPLIWLQTPPINVGKSYTISLCAEVLGLGAQDMLPTDPQLLSAGNSTLIVAVRDKLAVDRAWLDLAGLKRLKGTEQESMCVLLFAPTPDGVYARMFAPEYGIPEDPAAGSSVGPLASYMIQHGLISDCPGTRFVCEQGTQMGRRSLLHVDIQGAQQIYVGGHVTSVAEGILTLTSVMKSGAEN